MVIDDGNKRVTSFRFKGVHRNGTIHVEMIEHQIKPKAMQDNTQAAIDTSGQNYIADTKKNQINIFSKSGTQIGIYQAEWIKSPMAVKTVGRYFWVADTGYDRILLLKAPQQLKSQNSPDIKYPHNIAFISILNIILFKQLYGQLHF